MSKTPAVEIRGAPTILVYAPRERARAFVRSAFPKRKWKVVIVRDISEFRDAFRTILVDAALVDIGSPTATTSAGGEMLGSSMSDSPGSDDSWKIASLAHEFPSAPFFGITPLRATDAPAVARCASLEIATLSLTESMKASRATSSRRALSQRDSSPRSRIRRSPWPRDGDAARDMAGEFLPVQAGR